MDGDDMSMTFDQLADVTKNSSLLKDRSKGVQVTKLGIEEVEPYGLTDLFTTNGKYLTWVNTDEQGNVHVSCSCAFHRYVAEYALAQVDASVILYSNGQPPKEKNPEQIPVLCKHLLKIYDERGPLGIGFHPPEPEEEEKEPVSEDYLKEVVEMEKEQEGAPAPAEGETPPPEVPEEVPEPEAPPAEPEPAAEEEEPAPEEPDVMQPAQPEPPAKKPEEGEVIPEELIEEAEAEVQPEKHHEKKEEKKKKEGRLQQGMGLSSRVTGKSVQEALYYEDIFNLILSGTGGGPMDGGCRVVARSLQRALSLPGVVTLLKGTADGGEPQHYGALSSDGGVYDGMGYSPSRYAWASRFSKLENLSGTLKVVDGEVPSKEIPSSQSLEKELSGMLSERLLGQGTSLLTREAMRSLKVKYDMIQREKEKGRKSRPKNRMNYMKKQRNPSIRDHKRDLDNPKEIHATLAEFLLPMSVDADAAAREAAHRISELDVSVDIVVEPVTQKDMKKLQVQYNPAGTDDPIKVVKAVANLVDALFAGRF